MQQKLHVFLDIAMKCNICYIIFVSGDGTHNKKQHHNRIFTARGMTPIEKNIIVVDENGKEYEATYPKRAKGLVKNGRARFIDEHTICLACPPNTELEDKNMSKITLAEAWNRIVATQSQLGNIEKVLFYLESVSESASYVEANDEEAEHYGEPLEYCPQVALEKMQAMKEIACTREKTLKQLIDFYIRVYENADSSKES